MNPCLSLAVIKRGLHDVLRRRSAIGFDGVKPSKVKGCRATRVRLHREAHRLLRQGRYRFMVARKGVKKKPGKEPRAHAIASVRDAAVLRAISNQLAHLWQRLPVSVVGGRPRMAASKVVRRISRELCHARWGFCYDIRAAYRSVPLDTAIECMYRLGAPADLLGLVRSFHDAQGDRFGDGLIEGDPTSPLFLAAVLAQYVVPFIEQHGAFHALWLDDGLVLAEDVDTAHRCWADFHRALDQLDLKPSAGKTKFFAGDARMDCSYLGFTWRGWQAHPSEQSISRLLTDLERLADKADSGKMHSLVRGWGAHYAACDALPPDLALELDEELFVRFAWLEHPLPSLAEGCAGDGLRGRNPRADSYRISGGWA